MSSVTCSEILQNFSKSVPGVGDGEGLGWQPEEGGLGDDQLFHIRSLDLKQEQHSKKWLE